MKAVANSWSQHLFQIPLDRIRDVYAATVIGAKYPPAVADFAATWRIIHADEVRAHNADEWRRRDDAVREKLPQLPTGSYAGGADTRSAPDFVRQHAAFLKRSGGAVVCDCEGDRFGKPAARLEETSWGRVWVCARNQCGFSVKADALLETLSASDAEAALRADSTRFDSPLHAAPPREASPLAYSDDELVAELEARCGFDAASVGERALRFARHLQKTSSVDLWTNAIARNEWNKWQERHAAREAAPLAYSEVVA